MVFVASEVLAGAIQGQLGTPKDLVRGVKDVLSAIASKNGHEAPRSLPLLRDVPMLLVAVALGIQTGNVYRQWLKIDRMPAVMVGDGSIQDPHGVLLKEIENANTWFGRVKNYSLLAGVVAFSVTVLVLSSHARNGVYSIYEPDRSSYGGDLYNEWWANASHYLGLLSVSGIGMLSAYYLVLQNIVGIRILLIIQRVTYTVRFQTLMPRFEANTKVEFTLDPHHEDGCRGWKPMDQIFRTIFTAVMASTVALTFLIIQLGPGQSLWIGWGLAIFLVLNPTYILVPMLLFYLRLRSWKRSRLIELKEQILARRALLTVAPEADSVIINLETTRRETAALKCAPYAGMRNYRFAIGMSVAAFNFIVSVLTVKAFL